MRKLLSDLILDLAKCPNRKTCTFPFIRFLIGALPKVQNYSESIFLIQEYKTTILNLVLECFCPNFYKSKNGFPIACSNLAQKGYVFFLLQPRKLIFCQMACIYLLNSRGGPKSFDFDITFYIQL